MNEKETFFDGGDEWEVTDVLRVIDGKDAYGWNTTWKAVEARNDDGDVKYFVIEADAGYADWGACDTAKEAVEFLIHKWDEEDNLDESLEDCTIADCNAEAGAVDTEVEKPNTEEETAPQTPLDNGLAAIINKLIVGEWDTIDQYNTAIQFVRENGREEFIPALEDIVREENVHIGQLQAILEPVSPNVSAIATGGAEGKEQLDAVQEPTVTASLIDDPYSEFVDADMFVGDID